LGGIAGIVTVAVALSLFLAYLRREMAPIGAQVALAFVIVALVALLDPLRQVIDAFWELAHGAQVRPAYVSLVLKAVGVAYLTSIGAELARDAGEEAIGAVVELAGKVAILLLALPVVAAILDVLVRLLPG
jgi:Stage III sporulation protein AC/AD protein family.